MTLMEHHQTKVQTLELICLAKCSLCEWVLVYKGSKIDLQKIIQKHNSKICNEKHILGRVGGIIQRPKEISFLNGCEGSSRAVFGVCV